MAARWEVDPESKSKLTTLQSHPPNRHCIDCHAPSPQWASPKFGTFICLTCAGLHRSLGVHISFVRSVAMDSFKGAEVQKMEKGGNGRWREFYENHKEGGRWSEPGKGGDEAAKKRIEEVYGGDVGEEYKERLSCLVEGREFAGVPKVEKKKPTAPGGLGGGLAGTPSGSSSSLASMNKSKTQKAANEDFFSRKGAENAHRPDNLRPSEGGKYAGFGSSAPEPTQAGAAGGNLPGVDDFQKDPLAAVTKGWGWFSSQATKVGKGVIEGGVFAGQKIAEADLASQARNAAAAASKGIQSGTKATADRFNNFVENEGGNSGAGVGEAGGGASNTAGGGPANAAKGGGRAEPEKKDFWDSFGEAPKVEPPAEKRDFWDSFGVAGEGKDGGTGGGGGAGGAIGTAAMRKKDQGGSGGAGAGAVGGGGRKDGEWEKWD